MNPNLEKLLDSFSVFSRFWFKNWSTFFVLENEISARTPIIMTLKSEKRYSNWNQFRQIDIHE